MSRIVVLGDCQLDRDVEGHTDRVMPDGPALVLDRDDTRDRPGGAGLAATLAARDGHDVVLVTALSTDAPADRLRTLLGAEGVAVVDLGLDAATPVKTRFRAGGQPLLRVDDGGRATAADVRAPGRVRGCLGRADAVLVSCYGRGLTHLPGVLAEVRAAGAGRPVVWDPHPRGAAPPAGTTLATPNGAELRGLVPEVGGDALPDHANRARRLADRWQVGVAATLGARGALYTGRDGMPLVVPARAVDVADPCGAGDRFASALAGALGTGHALSDALGDAVHRATAYVEAGGAGALGAPGSTDTLVRLPDTHGDAVEVARRTRTSGGTVVATGGCFDLLHAGHVQLLESARSLGDCLIVCLNGDASVRRLKGEGRPVVPAADRARLLSALGPVDGVLVFEEDDPREALRRLRPDLFVKGGDYGGTPIVESDLLASWGGEAVTVPYLDGRSTTSIVKEVLHGG